MSRNYRNHERYPDPTAGSAYEHVRSETKRSRDTEVMNNITELMAMYKSMAASKGLKIHNRVEFLDKRTGKVWK